MLLHEEGGDRQSLLSWQLLENALSCHPWKVASTLRTTIWPLGESVVILIFILPYAISFPRATFKIFLFIASFQQFSDVLGVVSFMFILHILCWNSHISIFIFFLLFIKISVVISSNIFLPSSSSWQTNCMSDRSADIVAQVTEALPIFSNVFISL